jgi:hypothetical protein
MYQTDRLFIEDGTILLGVEVVSSVLTTHLMMPSSHSPLGTVEERSIVPRNSSKYRKTLDECSAVLECALLNYFNNFSLVILLPKSLQTQSRSGFSRIFQRQLLQNLRFGIRVG